MANLNPPTYTNGINVPHSIVGMQNTPRMLVQPQTYTNLPVGLGFPTRMPGQMPMPSNITQPGPLGRCTLRIYMFSDHLLCEDEAKRFDITHWRRVVEEFFSSDAKMKYVALNQNDGTNRAFVNFESGVTSIGFTINHSKEIPNIHQNIHHGYILDGKASFIYNYSDESKVIAEGKLKVKFNTQLKIEVFEFITDKHSEYVPRHVPVLPGSTISEFGIPQKTRRCLEVAQVVSYLDDVISLTFRINKGPLSALNFIANSVQQGVGGGSMMMARSNTTPLTPGPSPPETTAKTPKEKGAETITTDNTNNTTNESPVPSPSTSKTESPTTKSLVKSPVQTNKRTTPNDTPKQKRPRLNNKPPKKGNRHDTGS
ncbi:3441_t:CDS:2 [Diversispora eburnea]|uniref:3441_t:CDS:1 n=1 Tax=Diversispora eburnea TaxID=1213867 RepID=A0A9N8VIU6_9GLOM|nr:3441_t:CDS:2 [Diversispora eburnea]